MERCQYTVSREVSRPNSEIDAKRHFRIRTAVAVVPKQWPFSRLRTENVTAAEVRYRSSPLLLSLALKVQDANYACGSVANKLPNGLVVKVSQTISKFVGIKGCHCL